MACYPEEPRQGEEMSWQEPEAVQQRYCKVLHPRRMDWGWLASRHLRTKRCGDPGGRQMSVPLLQCTLSCTNKNIASRLAEMIISSSTLMQVVLESNFVPTIAGKTLSKHCKCSGGPVRWWAGAPQARRSRAHLICSVEQAKIYLH